MCMGLYSANPKRPNHEEHPSQRRGNENVDESQSVARVMSDADHAVPHNHHNRTVHGGFGESISASCFVGQHRADPRLDVADMKIQVSISLPEIAHLTHGLPDLLPGVRQRIYAVLHSGGFSGLQLFPRHHGRHGGGSSTNGVEAHR